MMSVCVAMRVANCVLSMVPGRTLCMTSQHTCLLPSYREQQVKHEVKSLVDPVVGVQTRSRHSSARVRYVHTSHIRILFVVCAREGSFQLYICLLFLWPPTITLFAYTNDSLLSACSCVLYMQCCNATMENNNGKFGRSYSTYVLDSLILLSLMVCQIIFCQYAVADEIHQYFLGSVCAYIYMYICP